MKSMVCVAVWTAMVAVAYGWSKYNYNGDAYQPSRRSMCTDSGGKCFTSVECCEHFVCAAFDDLFGLNPEVPGFCVREKSLKPCMSSMECGSDSKCIKLGRKNEHYCVAQPISENFEEVDQISAHRHRGGNGRLGERCDSDSDCAAYTSDGKTALCCQRVKRYRQAARTICDKVTPISSCITA